MELAAIIFRQILTMAVYMAAGYFLYKSGKITKEGSKNLATMLLWLIIPCVMLKSFCVEYSYGKLMQLVSSTLLAGFCLVLSLVIARLLYPRTPVDQFAAGYSNAGFMGIPLVTATFGQEAAFFLVGYVGFLNIFQWTLGTSLLRGEKVSLSWKQFVNPFFIAPAIGIVLFVSGLGPRVPSVVQGAISGIAGLNGPIAMIVLGVYLAQTKLKELFVQPRLYVLSLVRLLLIPLITCACMVLLPGDHSVKVTVLTAAAAPVGANVAVYSQLYDRDYTYACQTVAISTLLSIVTMPLVLTLGNLLGV